MTTLEIANAFAALCAKGQLIEAARAFWSDDIVSIEPWPSDKAVLRGRDAVEAKQAWWSENNEVHGVEVQGPFINGDQFALRFTLDCTPRGGARAKMEEVALYTVRDGKVVEERFFGRF